MTPTKKRNPQERLLRTFIAVTVPNPVLKTMGMLKTTIPLKKPNRIKWVRHGNVHLTLKFLGHTPPDKVDEIGTILDDITTRHQAMSMTIEQTGCFPHPERPRVLWIGVKGDYTPVQSLVVDINHRLEPLGFPSEEREYIPHITLGRIKYPPQNTPDISRFLNTSYDPIPFKINRLLFMSSELFSEGPIYRILSTHFLAGETPNKELHNGHG